MEVILVKIWGGVVIDPSDNKTGHIHSEEGDLCRQGKAGSGDTQYDRCDMT